VKKLQSSHLLRTTNHDVPDFRLLRSKTYVPFRDYDTLGNSINDYEEFILVFKRTDLVSKNLLEINSLNGPTQEEILSKTRHLRLARCSSSNVNLSPESSFFQGDLQSDLRKILSEIAKYSAFVLGSLPFAEKLILFYRQKILISLFNHQEVVKLLIDMGFTKEKVIRALKIHNRDYGLALDWLMENEETTRVSLESLEKPSGVACDITESAYARLSKTIFPSSSLFYPKHKEIVRPTIYHF
jgi:UBA/TS-N domain